jgi:hypothetical protein
VFLADFRKKVCETIELEEVGLDRFMVHTPFTFDDGDVLRVILRRDADGWALTDEGHTLMHVSYYEVDLDSKTRRRLMDQVLATYRVEDLEGELRLRVVDDRYGDCLFSFLQALTKISDITYLKRERVRSLFMEEFKSYLGTTVPEERLVMDYVDPVLDPESRYPIDALIRTPGRDVFVLAIQNDNQCRDATITILHFEKKGRKFASIGIFEDQEDITRKVLARFTDVCGKQFASLQGMKERFPAYIADVA